MVNWRLHKKLTQAQLDAAYAMERLRWRNHASCIAKQKEAQLMASKKRPPLAWDGKKKLPWPVSIYYVGRRFDNIVSYDLTKGFNYIGPNNARVFVGTGTKSFLVQRNH